MTENWTDALNYQITDRDVPPQVEQFSKFLRAGVDLLVEKHRNPGDVLTAMMNVTVNLALDTADCYEIKHGEIMMMVAHYFMDAAKQYAPEKFQ